MFDRPGAGASALIVSVDFGDPDYDENLQEFKLLVESAGLSAVSVLEARRDKPDAKFFIGSGKAAEAAELLRLHNATLVVFSHDLSPSQQRNLEGLLACRTLDRTGLILDIFAQRAKSHEGKLQVELAQLAHLSTRLVRGWTHLERQKGGIGMRGGPGETQLELDKRMIGIRVKQLREKLDKLKLQRSMQRRSRKRSNVMSVSLVGYTNAGKSTLFNKMTQAGVYAADQLFATLDTTSRKVSLHTAESQMQDGNLSSVVLSDTVGFIRHLPHTLVEAFGATLEEATDADLLLHVVDSACQHRDQQILEVHKVLREIGADKVPQILVMNQIDRTGIQAGIERDEYGRISRVRVSAKTGHGLDYLRQALAEQRNLVTSILPTNIQSLELLHGK